MDSKRKSHYSTSPFLGIALVIMLVVVSWLALQAVVRGFTPSGARAHTDVYGVTMSGLAMALGAVGYLMFQWRLWWAKLPLFMGFLWWAWCFFDVLVGYLAFGR